MGDRLTFHCNLHSNPFSPIHSKGSPLLPISDNELFENLESLRIFISFWRKHIFIVFSLLKNQNHFVTEKFQFHKKKRFPIRPQKLGHFIEMINFWFTERHYFSHKEGPHGISKTTLNVYFNNAIECDECVEWHAEICSFPSILSGAFAKVCYFPIFVFFLFQLSVPIERMLMVDKQKYYYCLKIL